MRKRLWTSLLLVIPFLGACNMDIDVPSSSENPATSEASSSSEEAKESSVTSAVPETELAFKDYAEKKGKDQLFNHELFYRNDLEIDMGDPMMVYDDSDGYFYAYGTRGTTSFHCFRSKTLSDWERLDDCYTPPSGTWSKDGLWAPDIQKINGKWYLYYTGAYHNNGTSNCQIGVAVADKPYGPFVQVPGTDGTLKTTPFEFKESNSKYCTVLDQHVFQDDDGELYMYFSYDMKKCRSVDYAGYPVQELWGVKMTSPTSWDLSTLTRLASPGLAKITDTERTVEWETWSTSFDKTMECLEGPYMVKRGGKYFLTYVANSYVDTVYNVGYAVSDSPLSGFVKPNDEPLQNMLLGVPGNDGTYVNTRYLGFMTGTGHASICKVGNEYMFAYHAHRNRDKWGVDNDEYRCLAYDYLYFDKDNVPYTRGPTWSINRLPNKVTGYHNAALEEGTTLTGSSSISGVEYLNDNFSYRGNTDNTRVAQLIRKEADATGESTVTMKFAEKKTIKYLLIGNSYKYEYKLDFIDKIDFGNGNVVKNVLFNQGYYRTSPNKWIFPHSCFVVELENEVESDEITFTFNSNNPYSLSEIEVYAK